MVKKELASSWRTISRTSSSVLPTTFKVTVISAVLFRRGDRRDPHGSRGDLLELVEERGPGEALPPVDARQELGALVAEGGLLLRESRLCFA